jgi:methionine aminopeptidase
MCNADNLQYFSFMQVRTKKMSKLEKLVPPLELCKLIPKGEFEDTVFTYLVTTKTSDEYSEIINTCIKDAWAKRIGYECYPAPTLQEILEAIGQYEIFGYGERFSIMQGDVCFLKQKSKTTAALKLWLKLKGIEA